MQKAKTNSKSMNKGIDILSYGSNSFRGRHGRWINRGLIILCLAFVVVFFAVSAEAGMVYGRVYCDGCNLPPQITFTLINAANNEKFSVTTNNSRDYTMFLPPGIYRVEVTNAQKRWEAKIRSYSNPTREDIYLQGK